MKLTKDTRVPSAAEACLCSTVQPSQVKLRVTYQAASDPLSSPAPRLGPALHIIAIRQLLIAGDGWMVNPTTGS